jgi:hypothetical protein
MSNIRKIKQRFCHHEDNPDNRNERVPFISYEFQCPRCKAYVAYFKSNDSYVNLTELQHNTVVEEGKKHWARYHNHKEIEHGD